MRMWHWASTLQLNSNPTGCQQPFTGFCLPDGIRPFTCLIHVGPLWAQD